MRLQRKKRLKSLRLLPKKAVLLSFSSIFLSGLLCSGFFAKFSYFYIRKWKNRTPTCELRPWLYNLRFALDPPNKNRREERVPFLHKTEQSRSDGKIEELNKKESGGFGMQKEGLEKAGIFSKEMRTKNKEYTIRRC